MVQDLAAIAREAGITCQVEPRFDDAKIRDRLDIHMVVAEGMLMVDVSICQATAESYSAPASKHAGSAARIREGSNFSVTRTLLPRRRPNFSPS